MCEWPEVHISDLAAIDIGGTPSRAIPAFWAEKPNGHPWISIADLKGKYASDTKEHITTLGVRSSNVKLIPEGTTVMSFKLTVGRTAITATEMYCNEAIAIFKPKDGRLDGRWLYHALPRAVGSVVTDTAVKGSTLNKSKMAEMSLRLPSLVEQNYIARVLDTLDTAIHETEAIIAKLKAVKQGLLHDLLTRGIDANGELRPPQAEAPQLYKESALGWIPRDWMTPTFAELQSQPILGVPIRGASADLQNIGLLKMGNLGANNELDLSSVEQLAIDRVPDITKFKLEDGDLLFNTRNTPELVGKTCSWRDVGREHVFDNNILRARVPRHIGTGHYFSDYLASEIGRRQLLRLATGTTSVAAIYWKELGKLRLPAPPVHEQIVIHEWIDAIDTNRRVYEQSVNVLRGVKSGLMDDLLTGRVRVTPLLEGDSTSQTGQQLAGQMPG